MPRRQHGASSLKRRRLETGSPQSKVDKVDSSSPRLTEGPDNRKKSKGPRRSTGLDNLSDSSANDSFLSSSTESNTESDALASSTSRYSSSATSSSSSSSDSSDSSDISGYQAGSSKKRKQKHISSGNRKRMREDDDSESSTASSSTHEIPPLSHSSNGAKSSRNQKKRKEITRDSLEHHALHRKERSSSSTDMGKTTGKSRSETRRAGGGGHSKQDAAVPRGTVSPRLLHGHSDGDGETTDNPDDARPRAAPEVPRWDPLVELGSLCSLAAFFGWKVWHSQAIATSDENNARKGVDSDDFLVLQHQADATLRVRLSLTAGKREDGGEENHDEGEGSSAVAVQFAHLFDSGVVGKEVEGPREVITLRACAVRLSTLTIQGFNNSDLEKQKRAALRNSLQNMAEERGKPATAETPTAAEREGLTPSATSARAVALAPPVQPPSGAGETRKSKQQQQQQQQQSNAAPSVMGHRREVATASDGVSTINEEDEKETRAKPGSARDVHESENENEEGDIATAATIPTASTTINTAATTATNEEKRGAFLPTINGAAEEGNEREGEVLDLTKDELELRQFVRAFSRIIRERPGPAEEGSRMPLLGVGDDTTARPPTSATRTAEQTMAAPRAEGKLTAEPIFAKDEGVAPVASAAAATTTVGADLAKDTTAPADEAKETTRAKGTVAEKKTRGKGRKPSNKKSIGDIDTDSDAEGVTGDEEEVTGRGAHQRRQRPPRASSAAATVNSVSTQHAVPGSALYTHRVGGSTPAQQEKRMERLERLVLQTLHHGLVPFEKAKQTHKLREEADAMQDGTGTTPPFDKNSVELQSQFRTHSGTSALAHSRHTSKAIASRVLYFNSVVRQQRERHGGSAAIDVLGALDHDVRKKAHARYVMKRGVQEFISTHYGSSATGSLSASGGGSDVLCAAVMALAQSHEERYSPSVSAPFTFQIGANPFVAAAESASVTPALGAAAVAGRLALADALRWRETSIHIQALTFPFDPVSAFLPVSQHALEQARGRHLQSLAASAGSSGGPQCRFQVLPEGLLAATSTSSSTATTTAAAGPLLPVMQITRSFRERGMLTIDSGDGGADGVPGVVENPLADLHHYTYRSHLTAALREKLSAEEEAERKGLLSWEVSPDGSMLPLYHQPPEDTAAVRGRPRRQLSAPSSSGPDMDKELQRSWIDRLPMPDVEWSYGFDYREAKGQSLFPPATRLGGTR